MIIKLLKVYIFNLWNSIFFVLLDIVTAVNLTLKPSPVIITVKFNYKTKCDNRSRIIFSVNDNDMTS